MRLFSLFRRQASQKDSPKKEEALIPAQKEAASLSANDSSDFVTDISKSFEKLIENLARQGYEFKLQVNPPQISKIVEGKIYLKAFAYLFTPDHRLHIPLILNQSAHQPVTGKDVSNISVMFPDVAMNSFWDGRTALFYNIPDVHEINSWIAQTESENTFEADILTVASFMKVMPDVKVATNFRGVKIEPILGLE